MQKQRTTRVRRGLVTALGCALTLTGVTTFVAIASPMASSQAVNDTDPDFGPNVTIIDPSMTTAQINALIAPKSGNPQRQIFFKPGNYGSAAGQNDPSTATGIVNATLNANTAIAGLGVSPTDTNINGALHVDPSANALGTFARSLTNLSVNPIEPGEPAHTMNWVTSQTAQWRRVQVKGDVDLSGGAFAFGNEIANSRISGTLDVGDGRNLADGTQGSMTNGLYYVRDSQIGGWAGFSSLNVFSGVQGAPADDFGPATSTRGPGDKVNVATTPVSREAPFLYLDHGHYRVPCRKPRRSRRG